MTESKFPAAQPHDDIEQVFPGIHFVTGTTDFGSRVPMRFSRNMTIVEQGGALTLVNTVRLTDDGLAALDRIGKVKHIIRLAGFHGMDDPFYKDRYGATVWSVDAPYLTGFGADKRPYFKADRLIGAEGELPLTSARLFEFKSASPREGLLLLEREGGILVSGDCLQNWAKPDRFFSLPARLMMRVMGFIKPHNVGPGWRRSAKPDVAEIKTILDLEFDHVLPVHGTPVIGDAKRHYAPVVSSL